MTKFYQDPNERLIRGVCAGLARGVKIDPIWVRIVFIGLLLGGFFSLGISTGAVILFYIALALLMPTKETPKKKA